MHRDTKNEWHALPYLVRKYDLLALVHKWHVEWITALKEELGDSAIEEEEDTSQHGEVSGKDKDKDKDGHESKEEDIHDEGHQDPLEE